MVFNLRGSFDDAVIPEEWLIERMRLHRNRLLSESDWTMFSDSPTDKAKWIAYRQALRDFPKNWVPSEQVNFPDVPEA